MPINLWKLTQGEPTLEKLAQRAKTIRHIFTDLDGSLLDDKKNCSPKAERYINILRSEGIGFTLVSGRVDLQMRHLGELWQMEGAAISCNGALIRNWCSDTALVSHELSTHAATLLHQYALETDTPYLIYNPSAIYGNSKSSAFQQHFHQYNRRYAMSSFPATPVIQMEPDTPLPSKILKYKIFTKNTEMELAKLQAHGIDLTQFSIIESERGAIDFAAPGVSKGQGLRELAEIENIDLSESIYFGDELNDLSAFDEVALSFAPSNAHPQIIAAADYLCSDNNDDAFAKLLAILWPQLQSQ
ncbi:MAG: Cof-type HAD-IIB family hydrolase [Eubacteriales bacterium]|nr:Cof-type HAD-IIB family hydrolase [Eubacteriales bacterium]